jgi:hypothetical protein
MIRRAAPLLAAAALTACQPLTSPATSPLPIARPDRPVAVPVGPSPASAAAARAYRDTEARLLAAGLLRRDDGDVEPVDAATLARNFERIALFSEYVQIGGRYVAQQSRAQLRRWPGPVRVQLHFGDRTDPAVRVTDTRRVAAYVDRLADVTGHPISLVDRGANFHVFVVDVDELAALGPDILVAEPSLAPATVREITALDRRTYCAVYASSTSARPDAYMSAIAVIRSEHPDLMRLSCYHEEIAQGLGLANDSPRVRPTIFNDDEEFALLTRHDENLLRILYDPRLRIGMTAEEARPLVARLAAELTGGPV